MVRSHRPTPAQLPGAAPAGKIRNTVIKISLAFLLPTVLSKTRTLEAMVLDFSNFSDIPWPTSIVSFPAHCISVFFSHPLWDCQIEGSSFPLTRQWALRSSRANQIPLSLDPLPHHQDSSSALVKLKWFSPFHGRISAAFLA